jgi:hemolysin D
VWFYRNDMTLHRAELEFLPAALEVLETPPSPIGRAISAAIALFFVIAIAWASFGRVDIIATAPGKVVPTGRTKLIQPLESGIVAAIHVQDGDHVAAGQILIELDRTVTTAERNRIGHDLTQSRLDVARLKALRAAFTTNAGPLDFEPPLDAPLNEVAGARAAAEAQAAEQAAKLASIEQQMAQKWAEAEAIVATIAKLEASLPFVEGQADIRRKAVAIEYGNRIAHLETEARLAEQRQEIIVQRRRVEEVTAARRALGWQRQQATSEYAHKILSDLADAEKKVADLAEEAIKADEKSAERVLVAPIDGTVQQLAVHTIGGIVAPAQQLMAIVPAGSRLEVEAMISNRDIGFVRNGQSAELKVDAFDFTRYGLLRGFVQSISQDAIVREQPLDATPGQSQREALGALAAGSERQGQELVYAARIALDTMAMQVENKLVELSPGMAVTVEIKTGSRRLIAYLLSPLLRYRHESLKER